MTETKEIGEVLDGEDARVLANTLRMANETAVQLLAERDALRKALIRVGNHAQGMPPSKGAGYIIAEVNSALADLERHR